MKQIFSLSKKFNGSNFYSANKVDNLIINSQVLTLYCLARQICDAC